MRIFLYYIVGLGLANASCQESDHHLEQRVSPLGPLGGQLTVSDSSRHAFSLEAPGLSIDEIRSFGRGKAFFRDNWVIAPASAASRDGLGPVFNARNCHACHVHDGRGKPPDSPDDKLTSLLLRISSPLPALKGEAGPVAQYGDQIQNFAIPGVPPEADPRVDYEEIPGQYPDGRAYSLRKPHYTIKGAQYGALPSDLQISPRLAPAVFGLGLLEAIPVEDLLALEDPEDADGDGISGRANWVEDVETGEKLVGRFGWKANQPRLIQQNAGAFLGDIGITSRLFPKENCASGQKDCQLALNGGEPELLDVILDDVTFYTQTLGVPAQRDRDSRVVKEGFRLFQSVGCDRCHTPTQQTGASEASSVLANQTIHPFTDLLLHDMGEELSDGRKDHLATGKEWRTPPLWGLGLYETVNGYVRLLHDGRARSIEEAILWHGGEGEQAREAFKNLSQPDRNQLIRFLESL